MKAKEPLDIPSILESLATAVKSGETTLEDAALELYRANFTSSIDIGKTKELLKL